MKLTLVVVALILVLATPGIADDTAIADQPDAQDWFRSGRRYHQGSAGDPPDMERAAACYTRAIQLDDGMASAYYWRGEVHLARGRLEQALADFTRVLELEPDDPDALVSTGNVFLERKEYSRAIQPFTTAIEQTSDKLIIGPCGWRGRGVARYKTGDYRGAIADFSTALRLNPHWNRVYLERGRSYLQLGERARAIADFTRCLELAPDTAEAYESRGHARLDAGQYQGAVEDLARALKHTGSVGRVEILNGLGFARYFLGDMNGSLKDFSAAIAADPDNANLHFNRARVRGRLDDHQGAADDLERCLKLAPGNAEARFQLGTALMKLGRKREAAETFRRYLSAAPAGTPEKYLQEARDLLGQAQD